MNFEPSIIVILAPPLSTILALVALFTPPENLAALIRFTIRVWQSELWDEDLALYLRNN